MNNISDQYLPTYKKDFEKYEKWVVKESLHYVFNYFIGSVAEKDINVIEETQKKSFEKIINFLKVEEPKQKIKYYFYPNKEIKISLMGDGGYAQVIYKDFVVHVLYTEEHKPIGEHEDTHLLSLPLGLATGFFNEGLAECLSWDRIVMDKSKEEWLVESKDKIISIEKMITQKDWMNTPNDNFMYYYSFAGFFVKKLIEKHGIDKFKNFYKKINREMKFEEINSIFFKCFDEDIISITT